MELLNLFLQGLLGFTVTLGFSILFNVPRQALLSASLIGAGAHMLRFALRQMGVSNELATYCGALSVGLVGYWQARRLGLPRLVFTVTGIISMIPGIPAYETVVHFSRGNILDGLQSGIRATILASAIAAGLSTARILTEVEWTRSPVTLDEPEPAVVD